MKGKKIFKRITAFAATLVIAASCLAMSAFAYTDSELQAVGGTKVSSATATTAGNKVERADDTGIFYEVTPAQLAKLQKGASKPSGGGSPGGPGEGLGDKGGENVDKVKEATDDFNLEPDTETASKALDGFKPILSTFLGVLVVLITIGMTIFSAFDIAYIAFPVFRNKCEDAKQTGSGIMASKKQGKNGETKLRFVSDEAQYAVEAADTIESGKNPFSIYFGKRVVSYVLLAIILFILLTGNINLITNIAVRIVSGILELLQGIGG